MSVSAVFVRGFSDRHHSITLDSTHFSRCCPFSQTRLLYYNKPGFRKQYHLRCKFTHQASSNSSNSAVISAPSEEIQLGSENQGVKDSRDLSDRLEKVDAEFYGIGYVRGVRAYDLEFKQGPDGIGVYSKNDIQNIKKPRIIIEVPMQLLITVSKDPPWMFFPDIVPVGHPIFEVIDSTDPKMEWDLRLACLLLLAMDTKDNFWQLYGDFLPSSEDCTNLLIATEAELSELQDKKLEFQIKNDQQRVKDFWTKHWRADIPLKLRRLARNVDRFIWAVSIAQSRCTTTTMRIGAKIQEANMLIPYADMLNHSFEPTCCYQWRWKDETLEVVVDPGKPITAGSEMTTSYMECASNSVFMARYGFSSPLNPWEALHFSQKAKIHLDSFLSAFSITGFPDEYYINERLSDEKDDFADGAIIAAARTLPTWSTGDLPFQPREEIKAAKALELECWEMLQSFPTTVDEDIAILESSDLNEKSIRYENIIKYRIHKKQFIKKIIEALSIYTERILF